MTTSSRVNLAIGDTYHQVLKLLAAARGITLTELVEEILTDGIRKEFERDPALKTLVQQLVMRDETSEKETDENKKTLKQRTLELLDLIERGTASKRGQA